jgi:imidazolonepropionase-like amidohydrolase
MSKRKFQALFMALAVSYCCLQTVAFQANAQTPLPPSNSYQLINGQWFDGQVFRRQTFYAINGVLTRKKPAKVDEVVDLKNGYVVPPFADVHCHHFYSTRNIDQQINLYLKDGVFYAKVQTDLRSGALAVADKVNRPRSVDVSYSHGALTPSYGHGVEIYEGLELYSRVGGFDAEQIKKIRESRLTENDAYYLIDTASDLERKWSQILAGKPDFIKIYLLTSEEYEEQKRRTDKVGHVGLDPSLVPLIVNKAHGAGLRVSAHVDTVTDYRIALKAGVDEMAHLPGYYVGLDEDQQKYELTEADAKETARRGVWVDISPVAIEIYNPQDPKLKAQTRERIDTIKIHNLSLLKRSKARIAFGSDWYGRTPVVDVLYLQKLRVFSNLELLKIWCEDSPRSIFPNRKIGLLKAGYEASFLVLDGNPLVDFEQVKNIRLRFKQGYFLDVPK